MIAALIRGFTNETLWELVGISISAVSMLLIIIMGVTLAVNIFDKVFCKKQDENKA